jgi:heptosyltransferase-1
MKICIVKLSAMGDIIHAMVALQFIKEKYPKSQIDWIVEDVFKGVLENTSHIDNILPINLKSIKKKRSNIFSQISQLRKYSKNNYDVIIDAQGLIKSALVSKIVGAKTIVGFDKDSIREKFASIFYNKKVNIDYKENVIDRNIQVLCNSLDIQVSHEDILNKKPFLFASKKLEKSNNILFVVGASKPNKMYPKELFAKVANNLEEKIEVVWASEEEKQIANYLQDKSSNVKKCHKLSLDELKMKVASCKLLLGADTGPTHMAWALNIPSITIFGPTPAYRNTFTTNINKVIKSDTNVDPLKLDYDDYSINTIDPKDISNLVKDLMNA